MKPTELDLAAQAYREAEANAKAANKEKDKALAKLVPLLSMKEEGAQHTKTTFFDITGTAKLNRSLNIAKLPTVQSTVPQELYEQVIVYKPSLNLKALKAVEVANPEAYKAFAQAITIKPGKPSVKIETIEQEAAA